MRKTVLRSQRVKKTTAKMPVALVGKDTPESSVNRKVSLQILQFIFSKKDEHKPKFLYELTWSCSGKRMINTSIFQRAVTSVSKKKGHTRARHWRW